jgi:hypothetical protein
MQAIRMQKAGLKGAIYPSQGRRESPYAARVFAMPMQKPRVFKGEMWCRRHPESFKACYV